MDKKRRIGKTGTRVIYALALLLSLAFGLLSPLIVRLIGDGSVARENREENALVGRREYEVDPGLAPIEKLRLAGDGVYVGPLPRIAARTGEEMASLAFPEGTLEPVRAFLELWYGEEESRRALREVSMVQAESYYLRMGNGGEDPVTSVAWRCRFLDGRGNVTWLVIDDVSETVLAWRVTVSDLMTRSGEKEAGKAYGVPTEEEIERYAKALEECFAPLEVTVEKAGSEPGYGYYSLEFRDGEQSVFCDLEILAGDGGGLTVAFNRCGAAW